MLDAHSQPVSAVRWPTSHQIISGSYDHTMRLWDVESGVNTDTIVRQYLQIPSVLHFAERH